MASMFATMKEEPHIKYIKGSEEYILITHCNFTSPILRQNTHIFPIKHSHPILLWKMKGLFFFCVIFSVFVCSQRLFLVCLSFIAVFPRMEMCLSSFVHHHVIKSKKQNKGFFFQIILYIYIYIQVLFSNYCFFPSLFQ